MSKAIVTTPAGERLPSETDRTATPLQVAGRQANDAAASYAVSDYLSRKAVNTIRTQARALAQFAAYLDRAGNLGDGMRQFAGDVATWVDPDQANARPDPEAWRGVTWGLVEGFVKWLLGQGYAVATVNNRLSAVKVYARLANKAGVIDAPALAMIKDVAGYSGKEAKRVNERRDVTRVGDKKAEHVPLTPQQAARLKAHDDTDQGRRDTLLMCLLLDHGLRVSEVALLKVADFDLKRGELRFYRPKVDKQQRHKLTADTLRAARAYFAVYPAGRALEDGAAIVGSVKGGDLTQKGMSERAITKRVRYLGQQLLDIENLSAHDCRHFWATDAARNGTDPFRLQEAGGWSSLTMPRRYVEDAKIANQGVKLSL